MGCKLLKDWLRGDLNHRPLDYECNHQRNLKTLRGAKSNALFLYETKCSGHCPCIALVIRLHTCFPPFWNGRAQSFQCYVMLCFQRKTGIPVVMMELKNQLPEQTIEHAMRQTMHVAAVGHARLEATAPWGRLVHSSELW
jgi:hypothetical protein